jgi:hypothetical protein
MRGQSQYETQVRYGTYSRLQCARLPCAAEYPIRGGKRVAQRAAESRVFY